MIHLSRPRRVGRTVLLTLLFALIILSTGGRSIRAQQSALPDYVPALVAASQPAGEVDSRETISLALVLPLRDQGGMEDLLRRLYDPFDPLYGRYLTPAEFTDLFGPTQDDYTAIVDWARAQGLNVVTHPNRLLLDVTGDAAGMEQAFGLRLLRYRAPGGRLFRAPDHAPVLPDAIAARLCGVVGLDTASVPRNRLARRRGGWISPKLGGTDGLRPIDITTAYDLNKLFLKDGKTPIDGHGQVLGLFELDGYAPSDIKAYEKQFFSSRVKSGKLPKLQNTLIDGFNGQPGFGADEVTLDIELQIALAPGASEILVYESPGNSNSQWLDCYNRIATDDKARSISTSWGQGPAELSAGAAYVYAENTIFAEMAAQGQSVYSASGDWGCFSTDYGQIALDDPTSPYMVTVGGTTLTTNAVTGAWRSETTWNDHFAGAIGASGGGISVVFEIPDYQAQEGVITAASHASTEARNMPDVALNADPNTGYAIYFEGGWNVFGGTSCAAPLWSAFNALVNQKRAADNATPLNAPLGFPCPAIYATALSAHYAADFHDIADGSTNGDRSILNFAGYPATVGFDDSTGWGTFIGAKLLADLAGDASGIVTQLLGNPGFEAGTALPAPWIATGTIISNASQEPAHSGSWKVWFGGTAKAQTNTLKQTLRMPAGLTAATLSFWLHIDTAETSKKAVDTLGVVIKDQHGKVAAKLATYSNLNANTGYVQETFDLTKAFNLSTYADQPLTLVLTGTQKGKLQTSFVVDDFALTITP